MQWLAFIAAFLIAVMLGPCPVFLFLFAGPSLSGPTDSRLLSTAYFIAGAGWLLGLAFPRWWLIAAALGWFAALTAWGWGYMVWVLGFLACGLAGGLVGKGVHALAGRVAART